MGVIVSAGEWAKQEAETGDGNKYWANSAASGWTMSNHVIAFSLTTPTLRYFTVLIVCWTSASTSPPCRITKASRGSDFQVRGISSMSYVTNRFLRTSTSENNYTHAHSNAGLVF